MMSDLTKALENSLKHMTIMTGSRHEKKLVLCKKNYSFGEFKFKPSIRAGEFKWVILALSGSYMGTAIINQNGADKIIPKKHFDKHFRIFA